MEIKKSKKELPVQEFNGKTYYLYDNERYFSRGTNRLHRVVWEYHNGFIPKGYHIHHVDGDTTNNNISNLQLMEQSKHLSFEGKKRIKENREWFWKEFHSKGIEAAKEWQKTEESKKLKSKNSKQAWENGKYKTTTMICEVCGKEYETYKPKKSKYCHQNCKAKALRKRRKEEVKTN
jgi:hypothetical protein